MNPYTKYISDEQSMLEFGAQLANACSQGAVIFLHGQLGAGKTTLVRGFLHGLGHQGIVKSPTYTLVESYQFPNFSVFHFDLYRIQAQELDYMGIEDYFQPSATCLIEWPENGGEILPIPDLECYLKPDKTGREIKIIAKSASGETILSSLLKK